MNDGMTEERVEDIRAVIRGREVGQAMWQTDMDRDEARMRRMMGYES